jgi:ferredoxin
MTTEDLVLEVDSIGCRAHGICADVLPELIELDEWGYPILHRGAIPPHLLVEAKRAAEACPALALRVAKSAR